MTQRFLLPGIQARQAGLPPFDPSLPNDTTAPMILGICGFLTGLAFLIVLTRCYVRLVMLKVFGVDDWIMLVAMACGISVLVFFIIETQHGLGRYTQYVSEEDAAVQSLISFYHSIFVMLGISAVKLSIGFFLLRVAQKSKFRKFIIGMIVFLVIFTLACTGTLIFQCLPVQAAWDSSLRPTAKCYSMDIFMNIGLFNSSINIATDVIFAMLPVPMFYNVQVNKRTRASLMGILSLGYLACAAAIVKTVQQAHVFDTENSYRDNHFTLWNNVELHTGIMAGSLPALKPMFKVILETTKNLTSGGRTRRSTHNNNGYYGTSGSNLAMNSLSGKSRHSELGGPYRGHHILDSSNDNSNISNSSNPSKLDKYNVQISAAQVSEDSDDNNGNGNSNVPGRAVFLDDMNSPGAIMRTTEVYVRRDRGRSSVRGRGTGDVELQRDGSRRRLRPSGMENAF